MEEEKKNVTSDWLHEWTNPYKKSYLAAISFAILGVLCGIAPYYAVTKIVFLLMNQVTQVNEYMKWIAISAILWVLRYLFHGISTTFSHKATFLVIAQVRKSLTSKLAKLPMGYLLDMPAGTMKNTIVEKVDSIEPTLAHMVPEMTANLLGPLCILIYLFATDWRMGLVSLITIPIAMFFFGFMMKDYEVNYRNYVDKNKHLNATAVEYINGIEVIKAFNQSASSYKKFSQAASMAADSAILWMRSTQGYFSAAMSIFPAVLVGILPLGSYLFLKGSLQADTLILTIILSLGIMTPLITAMSFMDDLGKIKTVVGDITQILNRDELIRPIKKVQMSDYHITLKHVSFSYQDKEVLKEIDLSIPGNGVTAIVGPSGSGKSTLAKLIASLWDVTKGSIEIGGIDIKNIPLEQLNENIAYVSQDNFLFNDTVRNNIRMGRQNATDQEVEDVAKKSGCHEFILRLDHGYETMVGGAGGHLSGGERQRIAIARAMLKDAPIIILDEATAYTDPENEAVVQTAVAKLVQGKTLLVIAHRLSTITNSDKIVVVNQGKIERTGTHEELLSTCALYKTMWNAHIEAKDEKEDIA